MKKLLFMVIVFTLGMSSVYADCKKASVQDDGSINATSDNGEFLHWTALSDSYKESCIVNMCGSRPSKKWLDLTDNEKAFCSLHICDHLSDLASDEKMICNSEKIQIIKENHAAVLNKAKMETEKQARLKAERIAQEKHRIEEEKQRIEQEKERVAQEERIELEKRKNNLVVPIGIFLLFFLLLTYLIVKLKKTSNGEPDKKKAFKLVIYYGLIFALFGVSILLPNTDRLGFGFIVGLFMASVFLLSMFIYYIKLSISETSINNRALKYGLYVSLFLFFLYGMKYYCFYLIYGSSSILFSIISIIFMVIVFFVVVYVISYVLLFLLKKGKEAKQQEKEISSTPSYKELKTESVGTIIGKIYKDSTEEKESSDTPSDKEALTAYNIQDHQNKNSNSPKETPYEKTLPHIKKMFLGVIVITIIASFGNKGEGELIAKFIGLMGALFVISFFIWLFFSIKDSSTTKNIKKTVKKTATDIMDNKTKPKDANATADAILKYHSMLEKGIISQREFDDIKKDLLGNKS